MWRWQCRRGRWNALLQAGEWQRLRGFGYRIVEGQARTGMFGARRTRGVKQARPRMRCDAWPQRHRQRGTHAHADSRRSAGEVVGGRPGWQRQGRQRFLVAASALAWLPSFFENRHRTTIPRTFNCLLRTHCQSTTEPYPPALSRTAAPASGPSPLEGMAAHTPGHIPAEIVRALVSTHQVEQPSNHRRSKDATDAASQISFRRSFESFSAPRALVLRYFA